MSASIRRGEPILDKPAERSSSPKRTAQSRETTFISKKRGCRRGAPGTPRNRSLLLLLLNRLPVAVIGQNLGGWVVSLLLEWWLCERRRNHRCLQRALAAMPLGLDQILEELGNGSAAGQGLGPCLNIRVDRQIDFVPLDAGRNFFPPRHFIERGGRCVRGREPS